MKISHISTVIIIIVINRIGTKKDASIMYNNRNKTSGYLETEDG